MIAYPDVMTNAHIQFFTSAPLKSNECPQHRDYVAERFSKLATQHAKIFLFYAKNSHISESKSHSKGLTVISNIFNKQ